MAQNNKGALVQQTALQITVALLAILTICFGWVVATSGSGKRSATAVETAYQTRYWLFLAALAAGAGIALATLLPWPHDVHSTAVNTRIDVKARQWAWEISAGNARVGDVVEFTLTTSDVSHGFGLYDPEGRLVAQMQIMPGFKNIVRHKFERPGTYRILCMEYCGLAHHGMVADFVVTEASENL